MNSMKKFTQKDLSKVISKVISEQKNLDDYKANFTAEDFKAWIDSEWDIELLEMTQGIIQERIDFLYELINVATRKEVGGFRN
jgi:hypothetical protein